MPEASGFPVVPGFGAFHPDFRGDILYFRVAKVIPSSEFTDAIFSCFISYETNSALSPES